jgi:hypothetical protein
MIAISCAIITDLRSFGMIYLYGAKGLLWSEKIKHPTASISFSPEGNKIAVGTINPNFLYSLGLFDKFLGKSGIYVLSTKGELLWTNNNLRPVISLRYSPLGDKIIAGGPLEDVYVLSEGCVIQDIHKMGKFGIEGMYMVQDVDVSPSGSEIVVGYKKGIRTFEIHVEEELKGLKIRYIKNSQMG